MSTIQTLTALIVLIFVLSVIVQAVQEVLKSSLNTKAATMEQMIVKFMGDSLTLPQVQGALKARGLDITDLENFGKEDFRHLLDGISFQDGQLQGVIAATNATVEQAKDNIASAYEAARASFQKVYTTKNKTFALIISFVVVLTLNASLLKIYDIVSADQSMAQSIAGTASAMLSANQPNKNGNSPLDQALIDSRKSIGADLQTYPILARTLCYPDEFATPREAFKEIVGLLLMGLLVSLGAPFWNDVLKGAMGVNHALNSGDKKTY